MVALAPLLTFVAAPSAVAAALVWTTRPVDPVAWRAARRCRSWAVLALIAIAVTAAFSTDLELGLAVSGAGYLLVRLLKAFFEWRYAGLPSWSPWLALALATPLTALAVFR